MDDVTRRRYKLRDLRVTRVDLVDLGANPGAKIVFAKNRDNTPTNRRPPPMGYYVNDPYENMFKEDIEDMVRDAAQELIDEGEAEDLAVVMSDIWEADPEAYEAYRNAKSRGRVPEPTPMSPPQTVREFAAGAIRKRAEALALHGPNWNRAIEDIEYEVLMSEEGQAVYGALVASPLAVRPLGDVVGQVRKSASGLASVSEAIELAKRWNR